MTGHCQRLLGLCVWGRAFVYNPQNAILIKEPVSNVALHIKSFKYDLCVCVFFKLDSPNRSKSCGGNLSLSVCTADGMNRRGHEPATPPMAFYYCVVSFSLSLQFSEFMRKCRLL